MCGGFGVLGLAEEFAELEASFVELRFAVSGGALEHGGDFVVLEALHVVEDEDHAISRGEGGDGALEGDAIDRAGELGVARSEVALWRVLFGWIDGFFQRDQVEAFFAKVHEDEVDGESMEPGGEGGLAAEGADLAEEMEKGFLRHVFGLGDVSEHA